jgi:hypothetical protein
MNNHQQQSLLIDITSNEAQQIHLLKFFSTNIKVDLYLDT